MKKLIIALIFLLPFTFLKAQSDTLGIKDLGSQIKCYQDGELLKYRELKNVIKQNSSAYSELEIGNMNRNIAYSFEFIGGALIGYTLGRIIFHQEKISWVLIGSGVASVVFSIPFHTAYKKHTKTAIRMYNEDLLMKQSNLLHFNFGLCSNGIGFLIEF